MNPVVRRNRQQGAVIVTVALVLLFLLGFLGLALDFGRLFIAKTELQTALDSCALAAAQELDGANDALVRATSAGKTAGNLNRVYFQKDAAGIDDAQITFSQTLTGSYSRSIAPADAKYAQCNHQKAGIAPWLLQAFTAFSGDVTYAQAQSVGAMAVATRAPSQTNCLMPVGVCQKPGGFQRGEWIQGVRLPGSSNPIGPGQFGWLEFNTDDGSYRGTSGISSLITRSGQCNLPGLRTEVEPGARAGAEAAWNTRFGIYEGQYRNDSPGPVPDQTGYSWYWAGSAATAPWGRYDDLAAGYQYHRSRGTPYNQAELRSSLNFNSARILSDYSSGGNRRVISAGLLDCTTVPGRPEIVGFGCFLMLNPIDNNPNTKMWIEYIGDAASETNNPCATAGLPGGNAGVRVPTLAR